MFFQIDPNKRQSFSELTQSLEEIKTRSKFATVLADITNLNIAEDEVMNKTILEKILGKWIQVMRKQNNAKQN